MNEKVKDQLCPEWGRLSTLYCSHLFTHVYSPVDTNFLEGRLGYLSSLNVQVQGLTPAGGLLNIY